MVTTAAANCRNSRGENLIVVLICCREGPQSAADPPPQSSDIVAKKRGAASPRMSANSRIEAGGSLIGVGILKSRTGCWRSAARCTAFDASLFRRIVTADRREQQPFHRRE